LNILDSPPFPTPGTHAGALNVERAERGDGTWLCRESRLVDRAVSVVTLIGSPPESPRATRRDRSAVWLNLPRTIGQFEAVENPPLEGFAGS
jgi:hypothetical protein